MYMCKCVSLGLTEHSQWFTLTPTSLPNSYFSSPESRLSDIVKSDLCLTPSDLTALMCAGQSVTKKVLTYQCSRFIPFYTTTGDSLYPWPDKAITGNHSQCRDQCNLLEPLFNDQIRFGHFNPIKVPHWWHAARFFTCQLRCRKLTSWAVKRPNHARYRKLLS